MTPTMRAIVKLYFSDKYAEQRVYQEAAMAVARQAVRTALEEARRRISTAATVVEAEYAVINVMNEICDDTEAV